MIDSIFQAHLEGREHGYTARNTPNYPPLEELWKEQQAVDAWYVACDVRVEVLRPRRDHSHLATTILHSCLPQCLSASVVAVAMVEP